MALNHFRARHWASHHFNTWSSEGVTPAAPAKRKGGYPRRRLPKPPKPEIEEPLDQSKTEVLELIRETRRPKKAKPPETAAPSAPSVSRLFDVKAPPASRPASIQHQADVDDGTLAAIAEGTYQAKLRPDYQAELVLLLCL